MISILTKQYMMTIFKRLETRILHEITGTLKCSVHTFDTAPN